VIGDPASVIWLLSKAGITWDLRRPGEKALNHRRITSQAPGASARGGAEGPALTAAMGRPA
jgi:hypothetical protein